MAGRITATLMTLLCCVLLGTAAGQSLGEVARQEAARREKLRSTGKVLTNADLPASAVVGAPATEPVPSGEGERAETDGEGAPAGAPVPEKPAAPDASPAAGGEAVLPDAPRDDEAGWKERATRVNGQLAAARGQVRQLKALSDRLALEMLVTDPAVAARAAGERDEVKTRVTAAESAEAEAIAARRALEHEARLAGVPPAWIQ